MTRSKYAYERLGDSRDGTFTFTEKERDVLIGGLHRLIDCYAIACYRDEERQRVSIWKPAIQECEALLERLEAGELV